MKHTERTRTAAGKKNGATKANQERMPDVTDVPEVQCRTINTDRPERGQSAKLLSTW